MPHAMTEEDTVNESRVETSAPPGETAAAPAPAPRNGPIRDGARC